MIKPITEWEYLGCVPDGSSCGELESGEPLYDSDDMRPRSARGDRFLQELRHSHLHDPYADHIKTTRRQHVELQPTMEINPMTTHMTETQSLATALLANFTTVICTDHSNPLSRALTFKKPRDMELKPDDDVVCAVSDDGLKVMRVNEVHNGVVNPDDVRLSWVVQKIDTTQHKHLVDLDQKAVDKIKDMQQNKARRELLAEFNEEELKLLNTDLELPVE